MKHILNLEDFLIQEMMSISSKVSELANQIYTFIKGKPVGYHVFYPKIDNLYIYKIEIMIMPNVVGMSGFVDVDSSKQLVNGWTFNMGLVENCKLSTVQHECNHIFQILNKGVSDITKKLNYVKTDKYAKTLNILREPDLVDFFNILYLCDSGEIDSMVNETYGFFKEMMNKNRINKLSKIEFEQILTESRCYKMVELLFSYNIYVGFSYLSENDKNKFFYLLEQNKQELDIEVDKKHNKDSLITKFIKKIVNLFTSKNEPNLTYYKIEEPNYIYPKPNKDIDYYDNYIKSSGERLKRKLLKLSAHFCL